jgi:hypothetical protein
VPRGADEGATGEAGVVRDFGGDPAGWDEGRRLFVRGEFGLGDDQAVEGRIEDVDAQGGTLRRVLDSFLAGSEANRSYSSWFR